jgi:transposase
MRKPSTMAILRKGKLHDQQLTIGLDLEDRSSFYCVLNGAGEVILEAKVTTSPEAMKEIFSKMPRSRIALETGTHSPWISRLLSELGHEAIVAHARNVRLIGQSRRKDDRVDAQTLARLARMDPQLLSPIQHRSAQAQVDLSVIRARYGLIRARTGLICTARGLTKSFGERIRGRNPKAFKPAMGETLSPQLQAALAPLLSALEAIPAQIREYDDQIEKLAEETYPEVALLKQVKGVGTLIALTYILTLEDPRRFRKSRDAGCYVRLQPGRRNSGQSEPQLHITREGDSYLRMVLVQGAQHILGPFGEDSDLRRWGLKLAERGGKNGKKRAIIAVARKLRSYCIISGSVARLTNHSITAANGSRQRLSSENDLKVPHNMSSSGDCALGLALAPSNDGTKGRPNRWQRRLYREHPMCTERVNRSQRVRMEG